MWVWSLGWEDFFWGGHGNPLQYSYLENPMDRGAWQSIACRVAKSRTRLNNWTELRDAIFSAEPEDLGFPGGSDGKESTCNAGALGSIPGLGKSPGEGHGNLLQYSCLENSKERGAWWATVNVVSESDTTEHTHNFIICLNSFCPFSSIIEM